MLRPYTAWTSLRALSRRPNLTSQNRKRRTRRWTQRATARESPWTFGKNIILSVAAHRNQRPVPFDFPRSGTKVIYPEGRGHYFPPSPCRPSQLRGDIFRRNGAGSPFREPLLWLNQLYISSGKMAVSQKNQKSENFSKGFAC
jgi:hypothetical protein